MQNLTAAPRDTLTEDQVQHLLARSPGVQYDRGLEVLDSSLRVVGDLSGAFLGGTVQRTMSADIHGTCALTVAADVDYGRQLLRPFMMISDGALSARFNGGVFVPRKPQTDYGASELANAIAGSDRLLQLNRPVADAYYVSPGTGYLDAALQAMLDAGFLSSNVLVDSTAADDALPAGKLWPLLSPDTSGATTWLQIVNDLLKPINYRGVWVDQDGYFRFQPYAASNTRPVEYDFDFDDLLAPIVSRQRSKTRDISAVPNLWIFQRSNLVDISGNPIEPTEGAGQYTVRNDSDGDTSIDARGGDPLGVYASVVQLEAASQTALVALGDQQAAADKAVATTWAVKTAPFPVAGHADIYRYGDVEAVGSVIVESTGWTVDYGTSTTPPADTTHSWQVVA